MLTSKDIFCIPRPCCLRKRKTGSLLLAYSDRDGARNVEIEWQGSKNDEESAAAIACAATGAEIFTLARHFSLALAPPRLSINYRMKVVSLMSLDGDYSYHNHFLPFLLYIPDGLILWRSAVAFEGLFMYRQSSKHFCDNIEELQALSLSKLNLLLKVDRRGIR